MSNTTSFPSNKGFFLDTSTSSALLMVVSSALPLKHQMVTGKASLTSSLFLAIQDILSQSHTTISEMDYIAVGQGPGTYTSLRLGAACAKAFSFALGVPLIGICSLWGYVPPREGRFAVLTDARSFGVNLLTGQCSGNEISYPSTPRFASYALAASLLQDIDLILSPDLEALLPHFPSLPSRLWSFAQLNPQRIASLCEKSRIDGSFSRHSSLELFYLKEL